MLNYAIQYPGRVDDNAAGYLTGKAVNLTVPGNGTLGDAAWVNDFWGGMYAVIDASGQTINNIPESAASSQFRDGALLLTNEGAAALVDSAPLFKEAPGGGLTYVANGEDWVQEPSGHSIGLDGPTNGAPGDDLVYIITDYSAFDVYTVGTPLGVDYTLEGDQLTVSVPPGYTEPELGIVVDRSGTSVTFTVGITS